jgi:hypothetical protein
MNQVGTSIQQEKWIGFYEIFYIQCEGGRGRILTLPPAQPQALTRSESRLQAVRAALFQEAA